MKRLNNRYTRMVLALFFAILFLFGTILPENVALADPEDEEEDIRVVMMISTDEIKEGDTVKVDVSVSSEKTFTMTMYLNYPSRVFEYVSGDFDQNGALLSYAVEGDAYLTATFKAIGSGTARVYTSGGNAMDDKKNQLTVFHAGATINVLEGEKKNENTEEGDGNTEETSQDTSQDTSEEDTEKSTENTEQPREGEPVAKINGVKYSFVELNEAYIPEGFTQDVGRYNGWIVPAYTSPSRAVKLVGLKDEKDNLYISVLEESADKLSAFNPVTPARARYIVKDKPKNVDLPDDFAKGFTESKMDFGGGEITVYKREGLPEMVLVYAINVDGAEGFYYYDTVYKTFLRYFEVEVKGGTTPAEAETPAQTPAGNGGSTTTRQTEDEGFFTRKNLIIISVTLTALFVIMSIVAVPLMARSSRLQGTIDELEEELEKAGRTHPKRRKAYDGVYGKKAAEDGDDFFPEGDYSDGSYDLEGSRSGRGKKKKRKNQGGRGYDDRYDDAYEDNGRGRDYDRDYDDRGRRGRDYDDRGYDDRYYDDRDYDDRDYDDRDYDDRDYDDRDYDDRDYDDGGYDAPEEPKPLEDPVSGETIEIVMVEAEDNNRDVHVPPRVDQKVDRVEEAMKKRPFGIDSAFDVVDEDSEEAARSTEEPVDRPTPRHVKSEAPQKVAFPTRDEEED